MGTWTITAGAGSLASAMGYQLSYAGSGTLTVAQKALTITGLSGIDKVYDGTAADPITRSGSLSGAVRGDAVTLNNGTASFADANVGNNKAVTFFGYTISGRADDRPRSRDTRRKHGRGVPHRVARQVYHLFQSGQLPGRKVGRKWVTTKAAVIRWIEHSSADDLLARAVKRGDGHAIAKAINTGKARVRPSPRS